MNQRTKNPEGHWVSFQNRYFDLAKVTHFQFSKSQNTGEATLQVVFLNKDVISIGSVDTEKCEEFVVRIIKGEYDVIK